VWPSEPDAYAYSASFRGALGRYFANSVLVAVTTGALGGCHLSAWPAIVSRPRLRFVGKGVISPIVLAGLWAVPATIVPLFVMSPNSAINSYPHILAGWSAVFGVFMRPSFSMLCARDARGGLATARAFPACFQYLFPPGDRPGTLALLTFLQSWTRVVADDVAPNPDMRICRWMALSASRRRMQTVMAAIVVAPSGAGAFLIAQRQLIAGYRAGAVRSGAQAAGPSESVLGGDNCEGAGCL